MRPDFSKLEYKKESDFLQKFKASSHVKATNEEEFVDYVNTWFNDSNKPVQK